MTTTVDDFLSGRLRIEQPAQGYRAGVDPVFLAAACAAKAGQDVLDLGCGVGTAALCLAARVPVQVAGVELTPDYAALAQANAARNGIDMQVVAADATARPTPFSDRSFHHVITNPPYFTDGHVAQDAGRAAGRSGDVDMGLWVGTAFKRLRHRGTLTLIQRIERLPEILAACTGFGGIQVLPLAPRVARDPKLFLLRAVKEARAPFRLLPALILHNGTTHEKDTESYVPAIRQVLRDGAALPWGDYSTKPLP